MSNVSWLPWQRFSAAKARSAAAESPPLARSEPNAAGRWERYLLEAVEGDSLAAFRVLFGILMVVEVARFFGNGWIARYYIEPGFHFGFVPGIRPWDGAGMYWHFGALGVLALLIAAGWFYRWASALFFLGFTYVFLLDKAQYLNHFYLICLLSLLLVVAPAHAWGSVDAWRYAAGRAPQVRRWHLLLFRLQIALVYFFGGIAKLNWDWFRGEPQRAWLAARAKESWLGDWLASEGVVMAVTYGGLVVDLAVGFLLCFRRTFWLGAVLAIVFNLANAHLFQIGIFPFMMLGALVLFLEPGAISRIVRDRIDGGWAARLTPAAPVAGVTEGRSSRAGFANRAGLVFFHGYLLIQVLLPFRHWLYPGSVHWTEEGHRFSWHMKLRDKQAVINFFATDPRTGERRLVEMRRWLSNRQIAKMSNRPDMILQFAHFLADEIEAETSVRPRITAHAVASLNGRPYQYLVDPSVDLASEPRTLGPKKWILPLQEDSAASRPSHSL